MKEHQILARSQMYRLLSIAFSYPSEEFRTESNRSELISTLVENAEMLRGYGLRPCVKSVAKTFEKYKDSLFERIESEYLELFGQEHTVGCMPYELDYLKGPLFMKTGELADIAGFYKAFGLEVSEGNRDRLDHIGIELEFMYVLTLKEAFAVKNGTTEERNICRDAQKKFLTDHLGRWTEVLHCKIQKDGESDLYNKLSLMLDKFITRDSKKLGATPEKIKVSVLTLNPSSSPLSYP